ncbi:MAG: 3-oxoacid CoA-transferase subunit B [Dehalococcoidia bacterium]
MALSRELMAMRVARELAPGMVVNLGIGLPTLVAGFAPAGVMFQAENGILGYGGIVVDDDRFDSDVINAGGQPVEILPGACYFASDASFAMIRGGHVDVAVLGGLQVSERGDLANWLVPSRGGGSIGGAMDLAVGARRVIVVMEHTTRDGEARILPSCTYPLTGTACVRLIVTDLAVIEVTDAGLALREVAPGVTAAEVVERTAARLVVPPHIDEMRL